MTLADIIGSLGVGMILLAYFLQVFEKIKPENTLFFLLNIVGAALACSASLLINYLPFVILEGTWCVVSVVGFFRKWFKTRV